MFYIIVFSFNVSLKLLIQQDLLDSQISIQWNKITHNLLMNSLYEYMRCTLHGEFNPFKTSGLLNSNQNVYSSITHSMNLYRKSFYSRINIYTSGEVNSETTYIFRISEVRAKQNSQIYSSFFCMLFNQMPEPSWDWSLDIL